MMDQTERVAGREKDEVARAIDLVQKHWTLHIVRDLANGPKRRKDIQASTGASTESLTTALRHMMAEGLVDRTPLEGSFPQRVDYSLTPQGRDLIPVVTVLAEYATLWEGR